MSLLTASEPRTFTPAQERDVVVRLQDVSVRYAVPQEPIHSLKEYVIRRAKNQIHHREFWALRDVNIELKQGEALGIIGRNGAGKSTLLKVVSRVMRPTLGNVWVRGNVAPLLELGAGFHAELTGRENVFLNGTLLGHAHREIAERFDAIVDFAGIWDFIDAPLRTYSTGMAARLGFAVATAWQPDILILDEVLSVGDAEFQLKSAERIQELRAQGATVLLVSHSLDSVQQICDQVAWMDLGRVQALGVPDQVVPLYHDETVQIYRTNQLAHRWGSPEQFRAARANGTVYDDYYFQYCCGQPYDRSPVWLRNFDLIAQHIVETIAPRRALDVGCAIGLLVESLRARRVEAFGIDISRYAIDHVHESIKPYCSVASVLEPLTQKYDLVACIEVLQNLLPIEGERAIANLCQATDDILFSANPTDRRSPTHVNVQPVEYWEQLFAAQGFERDLEFDASFLTPWAMRVRRLR